MPVSTERLTAEADESHAGQRLDRFLSDRLPGLSRTRLQALIREGRVALGPATIEDVKYPVKPGDRFEISVPPPVNAKPLAQEIPLDVAYEDECHHRHRQACRPRRASRRRQYRPHPGQRAHRPLRGEPLRHRRRGAPGHRASPRQGHERPPRRRQDRPGPSRAVGAIRRSWPRGRARARLSRACLGRAAAAARHHRRTDRPPQDEPHQDGHRARGARRTRRRDSLPGGRDLRSRA